MGTLKVDNIQTESGSAIITNGAIPESTLRNLMLVLHYFQHRQHLLHSINFDSSVLQLTMNHIMW